MFQHKQNIYSDQSKLAHSDTDTVFTWVQAIYTFVEDIADDVVRPIDLLERINFLSSLIYNTYIAISKLALKRIDCIEKSSLSEQDKIKLIEKFQNEIQEKLANLYEYDEYIDAKYYEKGLASLQNKRERVNEIATPVATPANTEIVSKTKRSDLLGLPAPFRTLPLPQFSREKTIEFLKSHPPSKLPPVLAILPPSLKKRVSAEKARRLPLQRDSIHSLFSFPGFLRS